MIVVSGTSSRHVNAIVNKIAKSHKKYNLMKDLNQQITNCWFTYILNVFKPEARQHYSLEKIWKDNDLKDEKLIRLIMMINILFCRFKLNQNYRQIFEYCRKRIWLKQK